MSLVAKFKRKLDESNGQNALMAALNPKDYVSKDPGSECVIIDFGNLPAIVNMNMTDIAGAVSYLSDALSAAETRAKEIENQRALARQKKNARKRAKRGRLCKPSESSASSTTTEPSASSTSTDPSTLTEPSTSNAVDPSTSSEPSTLTDSSTSSEPSTPNEYSKLVEKGKFAISIGQLEDLPKTIDPPPKSKLLVVGRAAVVRGKDKPLLTYWTIGCNNMRYAYIKQQMSGGTSEEILSKLIREFAAEE